MREGTVMLKKEETIKGAIVEVFQIKKGVAGASPDHANAACVTVTAEAGGFLNGGKGVGVGMRLEIVAPPKKRNGINTVVVKFPVEGGEYRRPRLSGANCVPAANWCEASPTVPDRLLSYRHARSLAYLKQFSEKQLARLPAAGYWVR
jgi:hypothetical protein